VGLTQPVAQPTARAGPIRGPPKPIGRRCPWRTRRRWPPHLGVHARPGLLRRVPYKARRQRPARPTSRLTPARRIPPPPCIIRARRRRRRSSSPPRFADLEPYRSKPRSPQASSRRDKPVPPLPVAGDAPEHHCRVKPPPAAIEVRRRPPCCPSPPEVSTPMDSSRSPLLFPHLGRACSRSNHRRRRRPVLHDRLCELCLEVEEDMAILHITPCVPLNLLDPIVCFRSFADNP
jgi:hypothetical protein